jgi:predicted RecB family nuclease
MSEPGFIVKFYDKAFEEKKIEELVCAPVEAISGVSESDADDLKSLGIETVEDLALNKYVIFAQGINCLSDCASDMEDADVEFDFEEIEELAEQPVSSIEGISEGDAALLKKAFGIDNIKELAENKYVAIAQATVNLANLVQYLKDTGVI